MDNKRKILAIWGSPHSGKSVTALKTACALASRHQNVIVVLTDSNTPVIPYIVKERNNASLGLTLSMPVLTQDEILRNCVPFGKNPYLSLLGYKLGETAYSYAEYQKSQAVDLLVQLRYIADYIVVDCTSNLSSDILTVAALENADAVVRLCGCDLRAVSYFKSNLPLLSDSRFHSDKHIKVLTSMDGTPHDVEYGGVYGGVHYRIPFLPEIATQAAEMSLSNDVSDKIYNNVIDNILQEVFDFGT